MSDPFVHHTSEDIEASTAITTVSDESLNHAAARAADQVKALSAVKSQRGGRKSKAQAIQDKAVEMVPNLSEPQQFESPEVPDEAVESERQIVGGDLAGADSVFDDGGIGVDIHSVPMATERLAEPAAATGGVAEAMSPIAEESAEALAAFSEQAVALSETAVQATSESVQKTFDIVETIAAEALGVPASDATDVSTADVAQVENLMGELRIKVARTVQTNMEASVAFWTALLQARSPSEAIELNTAHLRRQMETFVSQSLEFTQLMRKAANQSMTSIGGSHTRFRE